ncbi:MAG: hypothetical protein AMS22_02390 [Thiotrichales bacterium SG8_50]|nr:MAG: hypothetical protein AMS22_02390 [Thiotrichales bacterium SG8_50]
MDLSLLITPDRIACDVSASSKKRALEALSELLARDDDELSAADVFDSLIARERLGGTGLGFGVAIPHGRLKDKDKTIGAFVRLSEGVDFDAVDNQPVDLLFALLVPENSTEEHLQILATLAELFNRSEVRDALRQAKSVQAIHALLTSRRGD